MKLTLHRIGILLCLTSLAWTAPSQEGPVPRQIGQKAAGKTPKKPVLPNWHFIDRATIPDATPDMPRHVRMLYSEKVDMMELQQAFADHYAGRDMDAPLEDLERDPHAKFFHQWFMQAQDYVDDFGIIQVMSTNAVVASRAASAQNAASLKAPAHRWTFVGPKKTLWRADHNADQPEAPWQVNIYCIDAAPSNPAILYCGSETGVLYKSTDRGQNWVPFNNFNWGAAILSVAIDPADPNIVFAATSSDIIKTTNGGRTWSIAYTSAGLSCNSLAFSPSVQGTLFAGTAQGLLRSIDGGANWTQSLTKHVDDVMFRPGDGSTLYVLQRSGTPDTYDFMKSVDGGVSFTSSMVGWGTLYERSGGRICVSQANPDYVYALLLTHDGNDGDQKPYLMKSTDAAGTWSAVAIGGAALPLNNGQGYYDMDVVASQSDPEKVIVATTTAYSSTDGGANWTAVGGYTGPFGIHPDIQCMLSILDGANEDTWIATDGGVNFSSDFYSDPDNWESRTSGLDGTDFWGFAQGWNEDYIVGGRYHNGNTALHENYPEHIALRLGGAESVTGWALHGRERYAAFDDISELIIPAQVDEAPEGTFAFSKHPQNYYYGNAFSRVMVDLEDFMTVYLGSGNSFWRSQDGGGSWEAIATISGKPYHFDISRASGDHIYLAADDGFYRSTDRGESFTEMSLPAGLTDWHSQNLRVAASSMDPDEVWVLNHRSSASSSAGRVFRSNDGGASWTDLTTPALSGRSWRAIAHQAGTDGGIYIASSRGATGTNPSRVFYRNNQMTDWKDYSAGLPASANPIKILPFYRDQKLRWGGNRGAWEIEFYESDWSLLAQPFVSGKGQACLRDTVEFDSYSIASGDATYSWSIPGANLTTDLNEREVYATFPAIGTYSATLTVTQGNQVDSKSVDVTISDECSAETTAGNAIALGGASSDYAKSLHPLAITTNTFTISAWIKRDGDQPSYAGIVFARGSSSAGLNFKAGNELGFHWSNDQWGWGSGLIVPDDEWVHVAMAVGPTQTSLFLNGIEAVNTADPAAHTFDSPIVFGADEPWGSRRFRGEMDEIALYDRTLDQTEIRELMHLTRSPATDPNLVAYWQFNRSTGIVTDRVGVNHVTLQGDTLRLPSTAPIGGGQSHMQSIVFGGTMTFGNTGLDLVFPSSGTTPIGEVCVTRIDQAPNIAPAGGQQGSYWIVENFGANATFAELNGLVFTTNIDQIQASIPGLISLWKRPARSDGGWVGPECQASSATVGAPGSVTFGAGNNQTSFGQYFVLLP